MVSLVLERLVIFFFHRNKSLVPYMECLKESTEKTLNEVVLVIPPEPIATPDSSNNSSKDAKLEAMQDPCNARPKTSTSEILKASGMSPKKPPRPPQSEALVRRRSISKPKSRFEEPANPTGNYGALTYDRPPSSPYNGSPNRKAPGTPRSPHPNVDEDEEEEDVCKKEQLHESGERRRKCRLWLIIEWLIFIMATSCLITSLLVQRLRGYVIWGLHIWRWCLMVMVICCGRLVAHWFVTVLVFFIEINFLFRKKVLYFVYGLKKSFQVCIWVGLILLCWLLIFNDDDIQISPKTAKALKYVTRALASMLIGSIIWLVKTLSVKMLASSFHMNRYFERIQGSLYHQYLLQTLSGPPSMEMSEKVGPVKSSGQLSFRNIGKGNDKGKIGELEVIDIAKLHRLSQEKVSAWAISGLVNAIRSSGLSTISNKIDESFDEDKGEQKEQEITNEREARLAAYQIFKNVAKPGYKYIEVEDLMRFLSKEEVAYIVPLFEGASESGKIKKSALRNWVVKAYLDRKALAHSLNDTKTAVRQLHRLLTVVIIVLIIVITLLMMGFATTKVLVFISSQLLLLGFIFTNSCKMAFEAIIFVFVMHPFDVGDRCVIDGVQMIVEEMNILTTIFLQSDNTKIYYPNSVLATKPIRNFYRSPDMGDSVEFSVDISTTMENISALKARIKTYLENKPNHWRQNHSLVVKDIVNVNKMNMVLYVKHTMNYQNIVEKNSRRTDLILELKKIFEELSVQYNLLPQAVHLSYTGSNPLPMSVSQG
ncbi:Mechanosensitive ion channel protein 10 [Apostasia shenzhenica]|uniref:Mechanosensitive ion channel protein n=1 Tax=Apostasia shenzhenica TaxID=1088818 RepID=A0A2I0A344_9ASPA|nr:Mechanosensitive ion channel protein 10 [Apostasia shenzhenica]